MSARDKDLQEAADALNELFGRGPIFPGRVVPHAEVLDELHTVNGPLDIRLTPSLLFGGASFFPPFLGNFQSPRFREYALKQRNGGIEKVLGFLPGQRALVRAVVAIFADATRQVTKVTWQPALFEKPRQSRTKIAASPVI